MVSSIDVSYCYYSVPWNKMLSVLKELIIGVGGDGGWLIFWKLFVYAINVY